MTREDARAWIVKEMQRPGDQELIEAYRNRRGWTLRKQLAAVARTRLDLVASGHRGHTAKMCFRDLLVPPKTIDNHRRIDHELKHN